MFLCSIDDSPGRRQQMNVVNTIRLSHCVLLTERPNDPTTLRTKKLRISGNLTERAMKLRIVEKKNKLGNGHSHFAQKPTLKTWNPTVPPISYRRSCLGHLYDGITSLVGFRNRGIVGCGTPSFCRSGIAIT